MDPFVKINLLCDGDANPFSTLVSSCEWEAFTGSRSAAILVDRVEDGPRKGPGNGPGPSSATIPIVRTTTAHGIPSQPFTAVHREVIDNIRTAAYGRDPVRFRDLRFNNAMSELYDPQYKTMRFHSDQALDLHPDSFVALFSCYEDERESCPRKLVIKKKKSLISDSAISGAAVAETEPETEIALDHGSVVLFSKSTNDGYVHKIVADGTRSRWFGLTLRLSETFIRNEGGKYVFAATGQPMMLATEQERKEFFRYKSAENKETGFVYPDIGYTLSPLH